MYIKEMQSVLNAFTSSLQFLLRLSWFTGCKIPSYAPLTPTLMIYHILQRGKSALPCHTTDRVTTFPYGPREGSYECI